MKGPAAEVLPVDDLHAWIQLCRRLQCQRTEIQNPNDAARLWARSFSWDVSAKRHLEVYRSVINQTSHD